MQFAAILLKIGTSLRLATFPQNITFESEVYRGGGRLLDVRFPQHTLEAGTEPSLAVAIALSDAQRQTLPEDLGPATVSVYLLSRTDGGAWADTGYRFTGTAGQSTVDKAGEWLLEVSKRKFNLLEPDAVWTPERQREQERGGDPDIGLDFMYEVSEKRFDWPLARA